MAEVTYNLINQIPQKTTAGDTDVLAIATSAGVTNSITVSNLFNKISGLRVSETANGLVGKNSSGNISLFTAGNGLSIDGGTSKINGITATTGAVGVASFKSTDFTVSAAGQVSIAPLSIVNGDIAGSAAISHSKLANGSPTSVLGVSGTSAGALTSIVASDTTVLARSGTGALNFQKINSAFITDKTKTISANKLAMTDSDGYVNQLVKDLVYIDLFAKDENITQLNQPFFVPSYISGKKVISMGLGYHQNPTTAWKLYMSNTETYIGGTTVYYIYGTTYPANSFETELNSINNPFPVAATKVWIYLSAGAGGKGLSFWFILSN